MTANQSEMSSAFRPKRREHLEVIPLYEDVVVFDPTTQSGISLNKSARQIWDLADGSRTVSDIVSEIGRELSISENADMLDDLDFDVGRELHQPCSGIPHQRPINGLAVV